jgi:hypothetical protein
MYELSEDVRNLLYILRSHCRALDADEEIINIVPLVNILFDKADELYSLLMVRK